MSFKHELRRIWYHVEGGFIRNACDMTEGPGLKILGEVSVEERKVPKTMSRESRKRAAEELPALLIATADRLNETIREKLPSLGARDLILPDGRVNSAAFRGENGGPHTDESLESNRRLVDGKHAEYGKGSEMLRPGEIGEMALFCVLNRILGSRFLVTRTSEYDDYRNLVDFMIVDLARDGKPICAVDEFIGDEEEADSETSKRIEKKKARLHRDGGMTLRYGIESMGGALALGEFRGLSGIYAAVRPKTLEKLFGTDIDLTADAPSEAEWAFLGEVIDSIERYARDDARLSKENPVYEFIRVAKECLENRAPIRE